jgi:hypothetical protein
MRGSIASAARRSHGSLAYPVVAQVLTLPEATVRTRIKRGLERLRAVLAHAGWPLSISMLSGLLVNSAACEPLPPRLLRLINELAQLQVDGDIRCPAARTSPKFQRVSVGTTAIAAMSALFFIRFHSTPDVHADANAAQMAIPEAVSIQTVRSAATDEEIAAQSVALDSEGKLIGGWPTQKVWRLSIRWPGQELLASFCEGDVVSRDYFLEQYTLLSPGGELWDPVRPPPSVKAIEVERVIFDGDYASVTFRECPQEPHSVQ